MKELTASEITKRAIKMLDERNIESWRQSNMTYGQRRGVATPGIPDILGYERPSEKNTGGRLVVCEVKKNGDTLKPAQKEFLTKAKKAGVVTLIARQLNDDVVLVEW